MSELGVTTIDVTPAHLVKRDAIVEMAGALEIASDADNVEAGEILVRINTIKKGIESDFDETLAQAKAAKRAAEAARKAVVTQMEGHTKPLEDAKRIIGVKMGEWSRERQRRAEEERKRLEEQARKDAEDARLSAAEAAETAGDADQAEAILDAPVVVDAPVAYVPPSPKIAGTRTITRWSARITDPQAAATWLAQQGHLNNARVLQPILDRLVRAMRDATNIPGVEAVSTTTQEVSGR